MKKIIDIFYHIRKTPRGLSKVVHFDRLAPYDVDHNEERVAQMQTVHWVQRLYDQLLKWRKARFGVTRENTKRFVETNDVCLFSV